MWLKVTLEFSALPKKQLRMPIVTGFMPYFRHCDLRKDRYISNTGFFFIKRAGRGGGCL